MTPTPMPLEKQVANQSLSALLKSLGVKQESEFCWYPSTYSEDKKEITKWVLIRTEGHPFFSAFTVAELGAMLPYSVNLKSERGDGYFQTNPLSSGKGSFEWTVSYWGINENAPYVTKRAATEADARAKMLVYLLEKGIIEKEK